MSGLFSRHMSARALAPTWLVLGVTLGVYQRGLWIHEPSLWRIGAVAFLTFGAFFVVIALMPRHWFSRYWQDNEPGMLERVVVLPAIGSGVLLGAALPWIFDGNSSTAAVVAIAAVTIVATALLLGDFRR